MGAYTGSIAPTDEELELFGIMMGDGCISKFYATHEKRILYETRITGNAIKEHEFYTYISTLFLKIFAVICKPLVRKRNRHAIDLVTRSKIVFDWFNNCGFPCGLKGEISIPNDFLLLPDNKLNLIIRGIFDTDGQISARKDEEYRYPYVFICSKSRTLLEQIKSILKRQGFPAYIHNKNVVIRGSVNFKKWIELIGSNNPRNLKRIKEWTETGRLYSVGS